MKAKQYIKHSLLYFIKLSVLIFILVSLLFVTGYAKVSAEYYMSEMLSGKTLLILAALAVAAALYPLYGFSKRRVDADIADDREIIIDAFRTGKYSLTGEERNKVMIFHASSILRRIFRALDDKVTVSASEDGGIVIEGATKEVSQAAFRIESMKNRCDNE